MTPPRLRVPVAGGIVLIAASMLSGCGRPRSPAAPVAPTTEIRPVANLSPASPLQLSPDDWPAWRGPNQDGVAHGPPPPTRWSDAENVAWKASLPGRGHSSPIIVGERIFLETADDEQKIQSVIGLNRADGSQLWQTEIHRGRFETNMHQENSQATSTLACDGQRLFALFLNDRKIWATALDLDGRILWRKEVGAFASKFGYSASPALFEDYLFVAADHSSGGFLAALHRETGDIVWRTARERGDSYASPRVVSLGDKPQVILGGLRQVASYDPRTGEQLWATKGTAEAVVGTAVTASDLVFVTGGYPEAQTVALKPDGAIAWKKDNVKSYVPSLLAYRDHVYLANDEGVVICWDAAAGQEKWKHRIGGNFRVSPLLAGGHIYVTDMSAKTTVFKASPDRFEAVGENQLGTEAFASPAVSRGQLFLRVADTSAGSRKEFLYCIAQPDEAVSQR